jgi:hydroxypyruvate isomerase
MSLSEIAIRTEMSQAGGTIRAEETHKIQQWADSAELLGASHVRVFAGNLPDGASEKPGIEWVIEAMKPACDYAARRGITLGIENHGGMTARASTTVEILRRVRPARTSAIFFGATKRPIDLDRAWRLFAQGGHQGYMSAEYEAEEDPMTGVPRLLEKIKVLCRKYSSP